MSTAHFVPLKRRVRLCTEKASDAHARLQYVPLDRIEPFTGRLLPIEESETQNGETANVFDAGDVLFNKLRPYLAKAILASEPGRATSELLVMRPGRIDPRFLFYTVLSDPFLKSVNAATEGAKMPRADWETVGIQPILDITPLEQAAIAAFLDRETARIDVLIAQKQRLLALLEEKRQALVSHLVTKGLDPNAPMKESRIEGVGEIPQSWNRTAMKRLLSTPVTDGPHETPEFVPDGIPFASAEAMVAGRIDLMRRRGNVTPDYHAACCRKLRPTRGDIFMCKSGATTGKVSIVDFDEEFSVWSPLALLRANGRKISSDFLFIALQAQYLKEQIETRWSFGTQPNIGMNVIGNLDIIVPDRATQDAIVAQIRGASTENVVSRVTKSIVLLRERRQSIITTAVTGRLTYNPQVSG